MTVCAGRPWAGETPMTLDLPSDYITGIERIVGPEGMLTGEEDKAPYLKEWRDRYQGHTPLVVRPATTAQVSASLALCTEYRVPVTPQGGNTGLVGAQIPFGGSILLSLGRMNRIRAVDAANFTMTAEAGCILADLQQTAEQADRLFPLSLAAEGSCQIGGNLSSNAGGVNVLRYGNARDQVLGLEVVLADGRVWDGLRGLRKDNTGYDLKQLFIGAEGTLGVITAATLKLRPRPQDVVTAFVGLETVEAAVALLARAREASGDQLTSFELMSDTGMGFTLRHGVDTQHPFAASHPWYVLAEWGGGGQSSLGETVETLLAKSLDEGMIRDAALARSLAQGAAFWRLRELLSEVQKAEGGSIKHDVSVPISAIPTFIAEANGAVVQACPGIRPVPFGHVGDGNIHYNLSQPVGADKAAFLDRWEEISALVHTIVARHGGSISAEHGIGVMKRDALPHFKSAVEMDLMGRIKSALDPLGLMNPGKLLSARPG